jgi:hypothetical protein
MFTRIPLKLFQIPASLHETSELILAIEVLIVEITLMLKAVKNYHYNKKKKNHCNNYGSGFTSA